MAYSKCAFCHGSGVIETDGIVLPCCACGAQELEHLREENELLRSALFGIKNSCPLFTGEAEQVIIGRKAYDAACAAVS